MNETSNKIEIKEQFLGFCPIANTTVDGLTGFLLESKAQWPPKVINLRALHFQCSSHILNSVVNDAANSSLEISSFFGLIQETYVFFLLSNIVGMC